MAGAWNTIESDPGVLTFLIENLGVRNVECEELATLDPDELRSIRPVYGVMLLFKHPTDPATATPAVPLEGSFHPEADIFFAHQTVANACATQAMLSVLLNKTDEVDIGDELRNFLDFNIPLPPDIRGEALSNSEPIRVNHNSFARGTPFSEEPEYMDDEYNEAFHYVAYVSINGLLYELDGLQPAPILHGPCDTTAFPDRVTDVLCNRISRYDDSELRFSLLAMCQDQRIHARSMNDHRALEREEEKRLNWRFANVLRRHNFVGFVGEVLKNVMRHKLREGGSAAVDRWMEESFERRAADKRLMTNATGQAGGHVHRG